MPIRVLFICTGNSARSQIAEGLLRRIGGSRFEAHSAGTSPRANVHPMAVRLMAEDEHIDIRAQHPKDVTRFDGQRFDYVITLCDRAKESCPDLPGAEKIHWSFPDPAKAEGEHAQRKAFHQTLVEMKRRINLFTTVAARHSSPLDGANKGEAS
jgi:protein-tyrosine-phosphatase